MLERNDLEDFRAQCRRNLARSLAERVRYGFCYTYKPVLDDAAWRSFDSTAEYRAWCRKNLPTGGAVKMHRRRKSGNSD